MCTKFSALHTVNKTLQNDLASLADVHALFNSAILEHLITASG